MLGRWLILVFLLFSSWLFGIIKITFFLMVICFLHYKLRSNGLRLHPRVQWISFFSQFTVAMVSGKLRNHVIKHVIWSTKILSCRDKIIGDNQSMFHYVWQIHSVLVCLFRRKGRVIVIVRSSLPLLSSLLSLPLSSSLLSSLDKNFNVAHFSKSIKRYHLLIMTRKWRCMISWSKSKCTILIYAVFLSFA